jgi:hypothetical protein
MSTGLTIHSITAQQALLYKEQLTQNGLIVNQDYSWTYSPIKYNDQGMTLMEQSCVEFEFADPALASFYRLKWIK